jgi:protein-S-isoprenylcysteine O-methyltransferase Ste14
MGEEQTFRSVMIAGSLLLFPVAIYYRVRSQASGESLDRWQEGRFILFTLRPIGIVTMLGAVAFMINPAWMAWSAVPLPPWLRWIGVLFGVAGGSLLIWAFRSLGPNLTDTVVTRRVHTLVITGPYRYVRHPFYAAATLSVIANALVAANWFLLVGGLLAISLIVLRTRREEDRLVERFGDSYRAYMRRTGRFLPRIG